MLCLTLLHTCVNLVLNKVYRLYSLKGARVIFLPNTCKILNPSHKWRGLGRPRGEPPPLNKIPNADSIFQLLNAFAHICTTEFSIIFLRTHARAHTHTHSHTHTHTITRTKHIWSRFTTQLFFPFPLILTPSVKWFG